MQFPSGWRKNLGRQWLGFFQERLGAKLVLVDKEMELRVVRPRVRCLSLSTDWQDQSGGNIG
jgi:hypothetical protein